MEKSINSNNNNNGNNNDGNNNNDGGNKNMTFIATYRSALYAEDSNEFYLPHTEIRNW